jgi:hypothetical protein
MPELKELFAFELYIKAAQTVWTASLRSIHGKYQPSHVCIFNGGSDRCITRCGTASANNWHV